MISIMSNPIPNFGALRGSIVLITGAGGFIGNHLLAKLKLYGASVIAVDRTLRAGIHPADVTDFDEVKKCFELAQKSYGKPIEYIFHLAGQKSAGISRQFPLETLQESFQSTLNILEVARTETLIKKVILISSLAVYGQYEDGNQNMLKESDPIRADSVYSATKITGEFAGLSYLSDFGLPVSIARLANVYGPGQSKAAVVPSLISQMATSNEISMGNTDSVRDFIYVEDVVAGLLALALSDAASGHAFNVGTGQGTPIKTVVGILSRALNFTGRIVVDQSKVRANEKSFVVADIQAISRLTGWRPLMKLETGLQQTTVYEQG